MEQPERDRRGEEDTDLRRSRAAHPADEETPNEQFLRVPDEHRADRGVDHECRAQGAELPWVRLSAIWIAITIGNGRTRYSPDVVEDSTSIYLRRQATEPM